MTIGDRIKQRRIEMNMSQDELAKKVGYKSRSSIQKIESARNLPITKVEKMALALDTTPSYLMGWSETAEKISQMGQELAKQTEPLAPLLQELSYNVSSSTEEVKKAFELWKQIEVLPEDKRDALIKYLRFLQSDF